MSTNMSQTQTPIEPITGVRDLRSALEWYDEGNSRGDDGIPIQIAGVWEVICGKGYQLDDDTRFSTVDEQRDYLLDNRDMWIENAEKLDVQHVDRVISLLHGLSEVDSEYRVYGEDRERKGRFDIRTKVHVGLYHVTDKTTILTYRHHSPGMGFTTYTNTGVASPRRDVEDYLESEVFYSKYDYSRLE